MLIGDKYLIESDALNITLSQRCITKKTKREYWKELGFFSSIQNALNFLVDLKVKETELKDLRTVLRGQEQLYSLIKTALKDGIK